MERIIRRVVAGENIAPLIEEYRRESGASFSEASDRLMVEVAQGFLDERFSYGDADQVANAWWALVCSPAHLETQAIPDLARAIFEAFDEGEYTHGANGEPVEQHTIPLLRSALDRSTTGGSE